VATGGSSDGFIKVFEVNGGRKISDIVTSGGASYTLRFTGDGKHLIASHADGSLRLYNVDRSAEVAVLEPGIGYIPSYETSKDGKLLAAPSGSTLRIYDIAQARLTQKITLPGGSTPAFVSFNPNGRWLASTDQEGQLRIWEVAGGKLLLSLAGNGPAARPAWSSKGRSITVVGADDIVRVYGVRR